MRLIANPTISAWVRARYLGGGMPKVGELQGIPIYENQHMPDGFVTITDGTSEGMIIIDARKAMEDGEVQDPAREELNEWKEWHNDLCRILSIRYGVRERTVTKETVKELVMKDQDRRGAVAGERSRIAGELRARAYEALERARAEGFSESHALELEAIATEIEDNHFVREWSDPVSKDRFMAFLRGKSEKKQKPGPVDFRPTGVLDWMTGLLTEEGQIVDTTGDTWDVEECEIAPIGSKSEGESG